MSSSALRVAILADTHGFLDARVAEQVAGCQIAVHAGDIGGADILLALQPTESVTAIRGNNDDADHWSETELDVLEKLPRETEVALPGGKLKVIHGDDWGTVEQRHKRYRTRFSDYRGIVYGHTHRQLVDTSGSPWLLNPGAAGRTRTYEGPGCLILTCQGEDWQIEPLRFPPRQYRAKRRRNGAAKQEGPGQADD